MHSWKDEDIEQSREAIAQCRHLAEIAMGTHTAFPEPDHAPGITRALQLLNAIEARAPLAQLFIHDLIPGPETQAHSEMMMHPCNGYTLYLEKGAPITLHEMYRNTMYLAQGDKEAAAAHLAEQLGWDDMPAPNQVEIALLRQFDHAGELMSSRMQQNSRAQQHQINEIIDDMMKFLSNTHIGHPEMKEAFDTAMQELEAAITIARADVPLDREQALEQAARNKGMGR